MINIDVNKTGFENLVDLIVENNGGYESAENTEGFFAYDLTAENISFDAPVVLEDPELPAANTKVTVEAILDAGFRGSVDVTYYRPTLSQAHTSPSEQVEVYTGTLLDGYVAGDDPNFHQTVLSAIALAYGLRYEDIEIEFDDETETIPDPENENDPRVINVKPKVTSLLYSGAPFQVTYAAIDTDVPLTDVIVNSNLTGFSF